MKQIDSFSILCEDRNGKISINNKIEDLYVKADSLHLANAFVNILDNAFKYTSEKPDISISLVSKNQNVIIAISDNGIGIEKSNQKLIFQEFSRVDTGNIHNVKGFGLGLSYVEQVVKNHKGSVWVESKKDEGSTFYIQLPLAEKAKNII